MDDLKRQLDLVDQLTKRAKAATLATMRATLEQLADEQAKLNRMMAAMLSGGEGEERN